MVAEARVGRVYGFGSVFGKSVRDARVSTLAFGLLTGGLMLVGAALMASQFGTVQSRVELAALSRGLPPVIAGILGDPINVASLGGFLSWRIGATLPLYTGIWSIVALSSTLAAEASNGSLEFVAATPLTRRRIALEKVAAHIVSVGLAMLLGALLTWLGGVWFASRPGDEISFGASAAQFLLYGLEIVAAGSVAFAVSPFVGRGAAAGAAGAVMFGAYVVNGYASIVPAFGSLSAVSWFHWTAGHRPLAGIDDWVPLGLLAVVTLALLVLGVVAFERRDLGAPAGGWLPRLPRSIAGVGGALTRSLDERMPAALAWGAGLGLLGWTMAVSSAPFADELRKVPAFDQLMNFLYPGIDYTSPGGFLQLVFFTTGIVLFGIAAATLVSGWASDESAGRLELVLATPVARAGWLLRSGLGVFAAAGLVTLVAAAAIALGAIQVGGDPITPVAGTLVLGLDMLGLVGLGLAVGGLVGPSLAGRFVAVVTVALFLVEFLGSAFRLPAWVVDLSLNAHFGQPMAGRWDLTGPVVCLALAFGGLAVGALGLARRDLGS